MTRLPMIVKASSAVGTASTPQCFGTYQGSVVNIADPLNQGRVLLKVPQLFGTAVSNWALPLGSCALFGPVTVGQLVHVMFLGGNRNYPVYVPLNWSVSSNITLPGNIIVNQSLAVTGAIVVDAGAAIAGGALIDIVNPALKTFKSVSLSRTSTSLSNDSDLQNIPVVANGIYMVEVMLLTASTGNIQYQFNFSSSPANSGNYTAIQYNLLGAIQTIESGWAASNTASSGNSILIKGLLNNTGGLAGTFSLQWASNTASTTATVQSSSYMKLERFA